MEGRACEVVSPQPQVKASFHLGSEIYSVQASEGTVSEQLVSMKEESMRILKDFITKCNVLDDVADEADEEISSEDDGEETPGKVPVKSKKQRK